MAVENGHIPGTWYANQGGATVNFPSGALLGMQSGATLTIDSGVTETHANTVTFSGTLTLTGAPTFSGVVQFDGAVTMSTGVTLSGATITASSTAGVITAKGSLTVGNGSTDLPLAATAGFLSIPCSTGTPTGSIAVAGVGAVPIVYDRINKKLFVQPASGTWVSMSTA